MKVMITGCSGFLGHHFIQEFQNNGYFVIGVDKRPIPPGHAVPNHFIQTDVRDLGFRDLLGVDYVVHLAFVTNIPNSIRHPEETTDDNITMTIRLMEKCRETQVKKFLFPSTAALYGKNPTPWREGVVGEPIEPYGWQKLSLEFACKMYAEVMGLPTVIFRFFQIFGEFQREDTAIAKFMELKKHGKPITLTGAHTHGFFQSGRRDFIYAGDVANAVRLATESKETGKGEIFNVAGGVKVGMEEIAKAIGGEIAWIEKRAYEVDEHWADISKIKETLGWEPKVNVIEWLKSQFIQ